MRKIIISIKHVSLISFLLFVIVVTASNCTDDSKFENYTNNTEQKESYIRTKEEAFRIADQAKDMLFNQSETRSGQSRIVDKESLQVICNSKTRSNTSDTLIYIVNYADNEGFAIIPAIQGTDELLGIAEMGNYEDALAENTGFSLFMEMAEKYVKNKTRFPGDPLIETITTMIESVNPLLNVTWGQAFPEGLYCPNTIAGCANTAIIQICSYYEYPTSMTLTFSQRERDVISINWTEVKKHHRGSGSWVSHTNCNCTASVNSHKVIGEMARQCGVYSDTEYKNNGVVMSNNTPAPYNYYDYHSWSNASTSTQLASPTGLGVLDMIETLGFVRPQPQNYSSKCTRYPLTLGKPVYMSGCNSSLDSHAWVIDGYKYFKDTTINHATEPVTITESYRYYNHINWGGNGVSNGYFLDNVFSANAAYSYDNPSLGISTASYSYLLKYFPVTL